MRPDSATASTVCNEVSMVTRNTRTSLIGCYVVPPLLLLFAFLEQAKVVDLSGIDKVSQLMEEADHSFDSNCFDKTTDLLEQALQHFSDTLVPAILQRQAEASAFEKKKDLTLPSKSSNK